MPDGELDLTCALLPKKFMRFCSALLSNLWVCQKPDEVEAGVPSKIQQLRRTPGFPTLQAVFSVPREQERHERELATIDRERMHLLSMMGSYTCDMVARRLEVGLPALPFMSEVHCDLARTKVKPMLDKLRVAGQRPLSRDEAPWHD